MSFTNLPKKTNHNSSHSPNTQCNVSHGSSSSSASNVLHMNSERSSRSQTRPLLSKRRSSSLSFKKYHASDDEDEQFDDRNILLTVPFIDSSVDPSLPTKYLKEDVVSCIKLLKIPRWTNKVSTSKFDMKKLKLLKISGAMTNAIFKVEYPRLPSLLLRIYGPNVDTIIDRDYELKILARLSMKDIGPKLYGCFINGRFEEFLENSTTLTKNDIRDWKTSARIARRMKELHVHVPLSKTEKSGIPISLKRVNQWLKILEESHWDELDPVKFKEVFNVATIHDLKDIVNAYTKWVSENDFSKLCFCHNDAQYGNLLFAAPFFEKEDTSVILDNEKSSGTLEETPLRSVSSNSLFPVDSRISVDSIINISSDEKINDNNLVVIDFEYSGANPASFDLANHLSEWMNDYHCDTPEVSFHENYPNKEQILNFLYSYCAGGVRGANKHSRHSKFFNSTNDHIGDNADFEAEINKDVATLYNSIIKWRPLAQLHWALWGIIQSGELESASKNAQTEEEKDRDMEEKLKDLSLSKVVHGPEGEYIIGNYEETTAEEDPENLDITKEDDIESDDEHADDNGKEAGVDIDSFNNLQYSHGKITLFYADLVHLGIIPEEKINLSTQDILPELDCEFLSV